MKDYQRKGQVISKAKVERNLLDKAIYKYMHAEEILSN